MDHPVTAGVEAGAALIVVGTLAKILPPLAAALGILYYAVSLWESKPGLRLRAAVRRWWTNAGA